MASNLKGITCRVVSEVVNDEGKIVGYNIWKRGLKPKEIVFCKVSTVQDLLKQDKVNNLKLKNTKEKLSKANLELVDGNLAKLLVVDTQGNYKQGSPYQVVCILNDKYLVIDGLTKGVYLLSKEEAIRKGSGKYKYINASIVQGKSIRGIKLPLDVFIVPKSENKPTQENKTENINTENINKVEKKPKEVQREKTYSLELMALASYISSMSKGEISAEVIAKDIIEKDTNSQLVEYTYTKANSVWNVFCEKNLEERNSIVKERIKEMFEDDYLAIPLKTLVYYIDISKIDKEMEDYYTKEMNKLTVQKSELGYASKFVDELYNLGVVDEDIASTLDSRGREKSQGGTDYSLEYEDANTYLYDNSIDWYINKYGKNKLYNYCKDNNIVDLENYIKDAVKEDKTIVSHQLASYDGIEQTVKYKGITYYLYRVE